MGYFNGPGIVTPIGQSSRRRPQLAQNMGANLGGLLREFMSGVVSQGLENRNAPQTEQQNVWQAGLRQMVGGPQAQEQFKKEQAAAKEAESFFNRNPELLGKVDPEQFKTFGARQKIAMMEGAYKELALNEILAKANEREAAAKAWPALMRGMQPGAAPQAAGPSAGGAWNPGMQLPDPFGNGPATAQPAGDVMSRMMEAIGQMPGDQAAVVGQTLGPTMIREAMEQGVNWEQLQPREFVTRSGQRGVYGKGGQFQFEPGQVEGNELQPLLDPETGEVISYVRKSGPNSYAQVTPPKEERAPQVPASFHEAMDRYQQELTQAQQTLERGDWTDTAGKTMPPATVKAMKAAAQQRLSSAREQARLTIKRYVATGFLTEDQAQEFYGQMGIKEAGGKAGAAGAKGTAQTPLTPTQKQKLIAEANGAIRLGADRDEVIARLKKMGIQVK